MGVQKMDMPNLDLGVRESSREQMASELRPERGAGITQEEWGRKSTLGRGNSMGEVWRWEPPLW